MEDSYSVSLGLRECGETIHTAVTDSITGELVDHYEPVSYTHLVGALFPDGQAPAPEELRRPVEALERLGRQGWQLSLIHI